MIARPELGHPPWAEILYGRSRRPAAGSVAIRRRPDISDASRRLLRPGPGVAANSGGSEAAESDQATLI